MRNPLNKRIPRELRHDFGKYIVIFLFLVMLIGLVSGFLVSDNSVTNSYYEGFEKYNLEDGHITFNVRPSEEMLEEIEKQAHLRFYDLSYLDEVEKTSGKDLRVYVYRDKVNLVDVMEGEAPEKDNEIALERLFAVNNNINVGDTVTIKSEKYQVTGLIAVPDYSCLFQNNSDMMFNAIDFGLGLVNKEAFNNIGDTHIRYNYAWKYNEAPVDEIEEDEKSEELLDILEDVIIDYDTDIIQVQFDEIVADAKLVEEKLEKEFEKAEEDIEEKTEEATKNALEDALEVIGEEETINMLLEEADITQARFIGRLMYKLDFSKEEKSSILLSLANGNANILETIEEKAGIDDEELLKKMIECLGMEEEDALELILDEAAFRQETTSTALLAKHLNIREEVLQDMLDSIDEYQETVDDLRAETKGKTVDLEEMDAKEYENDMSLSFDKIRDMVAKVAATGLTDTTNISKYIDEIEEITNVEIDDANIIEIEDYVPRYQNNAVNFTGEDMGSDKIMFTIFDYIVIVIIAFVFAVTTSNTITQEAHVIGTLRASGYTKRELVVHYMIPPVLVTLLAAIIGNILGYTVFEQFFIGVYYNSYSLCSYETLLNSEAFVDTTVIPLILMIAINLFVLIRKLNLTPLQFLRGELSKKSRKKAFRLNTKIPILSRFRIRILFQNISAYITLFIGIFFGAVVMIFGLMFVPLLQDYSDLVRESAFAKYQYILKEQVEVEDDEAEKYCVTGLESSVEGFMTDDISIYGIIEDSQYIRKTIPEEKVLISNGYAAKYGYDEGDEVTLTDKYKNKDYTFTVGGVIKYDGALAIFMNIDEYRETFKEDEDFFTGYLSNEELTELSEDDIYSLITESDLAKIADQLQSSMGEMMVIIEYFGVIMFILLMYLLTKQIIERNMQSISITKILGFTDGEIGGLYLVMTSIVVVVSLIAAIPLTHILLKFVFEEYIYTMMTGYIPYIISNDCYIKMFVTGIISYILVSAFMMIKIKKISKSEALKNAE